CCTTLIARYSNKIGFATSVLFSAEAGQIDGSAVTVETGENKGIAAATIRTSENTPKDVPPLANEPRVTDGPLTRNPRDGLVTLIAYTTGEEFFSDDNQNGVRDANESFVDSSEPFVDKNDDGIWNGGEALMDSNGNGIWDSFNGVWDGNTQIWDQTWMVWSGVPTTYPDNNAIGTACAQSYSWGVLCPNSPYTYTPEGFGFAPICYESTGGFYYHLGDQNLNPVNESATISVAFNGKFRLVGGDPSLPYNVTDSLGTSVEQRFVGDLATLASCDESVDLICYEVAIIGEEFPGVSGTFTMEGPSNIADFGMGSVSVIMTYKDDESATESRSVSVGLPGEYGCF
ncbi:MAG TPA: hypothetical protein P5076_09470, partial [Myxococcota bacterium]|nr:hypothetical protein [Myxococcota bacterium]